MVKMALMIIKITVILIVMMVIMPPNSLYLFRPFLTPGPGSDGLNRQGSM